MNGKCPQHCSQKFQSEQTSNVSREFVSKATAAASIITRAQLRRSRPARCGKSWVKEIVCDRLAN